MNLQFARKVILLALVTLSTLSAARPSDGLQNGKNYYFAAEFKKAISQFEMTAHSNPNDAEPYLWLGKSYSALADIKGPILGTRARAKARLYLLRAAQLAPASAECRRELFAFLVQSDDSPSAFREARSLVEQAPESDFDSSWMQSSLVQSRKQRSSPEDLTAMVFGVPFQAVARLAVRPTLPLRSQP